MEFLAGSPSALAVLLTASGRGGRVHLVVAERSWAGAEQRAPPSNGERWQGGGGVDRGECLAQCCARSVRRIGEVHDLDSDRSQMLLQPQALLRLAPVVTLEKI